MTDESHFTNIGLPESSACRQMSTINTPLLGAQISEVYKWLCFAGYLSHSIIPRSAGRMDDIQSALEYVSRNRARDLSESGAWWDSFSVNSDNRLHATFLIYGVRAVPRDVTLGLTSQQKRSLPFLFSEFRGLALSLRSARDSEAHGFQHEAVSSFNPTYGILVLRIFDLADQLHKYILKIATSNREEAERFDFRLARPTSDEYQPLRAKIITELSEWDILRKTGSPSPLDDSSQEITRQDHHSTGYEVIFEDIDNLLTQKLSTHNESISDLIKGLRDELSIAQEDLRADLLHSTNSIHALLSVADDSIAYTATNRTDQQPNLGTNELTNALLQLRDRLYQHMWNALPGFKHYHSILQKPIINDAIATGIRTYEEYRLLPQFQSRIIGLSRSFALDQQEQLVSSEIESLLRRRMPL